MLQGTTAQIKGVGFTGVSEIQLDGAVKGARPLTQVGPQGCPVIPASSGGLGALLNSAPELIDRIQRLTERLTELLSDKNQNSIADILENVDTHHRRPRRARARPRRRDRRRAHRRPQCRHRRAARRRSCRQHQPAGQRARPSPPPRICARRSRRSQRAADNLDAMIADARPGDPEFHQVDLARGQPPGPRPARAVDSRCRAFPSGSSRAASAARSGRRSCPITSRGSSDEIAARVRSRCAGLALGGCSIGGLLGGGGKAPATLLTLTPEAPAPGEFTRAAAAGEAVTIDVPVIAKELADDPRPGAGQARRTCNMSRTCNGSIRPTGCSRTCSRKRSGGRPNRVVLDPAADRARSRADRHRANCSASAMTPRPARPCRALRRRLVDRRRHPRRDPPLRSERPRRRNAASVGPALNRAANRWRSKSPAGSAAARHPSARQALRRLLEHVLRQARRGDDPLELGAHQRRRGFGSNRRQRPSGGTSRAAVCGLSLSAAMIMSARKR